MKKPDIEKYNNRIFKKYKSAGLGMIKDEKVVYSKKVEKEWLKDAYARPFDDSHGVQSNQYGKWHQHAQAEAYRQSLVGRVITQEGLEGALVLAYEDRCFKVRLQDGTMIEATFDRKFLFTKDPPGVSSNGWKCLGEK